MLSINKVEKNQQRKYQFLLGAYRLIGAPSPTLKRLSKFTRYLILYKKIPSGICLEKAQERQTQPQ
jgi:hypothetical protein